jgi:hypothetical protein
MPHVMDEARRNRTITIMLISVELKVQKIKIKKIKK